MLKKGDYKKKIILIFEIIVAIGIVLLTNINFVKADTDYFFETTPPPPDSGYDYTGVSYFLMPSEEYERLRTIGESTNAFKYDVYVKDEDSTDLIATAIKVGSNYYIEEEDLDKAIKMFNGKSDYVKTNVQVLNITKRKDEYRYYDEDGYVHYSYHYTSINYNIINLNKIANFCGGKMEVSGDNIYITITSNPDAIMYPETYSEEVFQNKQASIKIYIEATTYNLYNNDGIYINFKKIEGPDLPENIEINKKYTDTPNAKGECEIKIEINIKFDKKGKYRFSLQAKDGVERSSAVSKISVNITEGKVDIIEEGGAGFADRGTRLADLEKEYGITNYTKPNPSERGIIATPAGEQFIFSTIKYTTYSPGGCRNAPKLSESDIKYRIPVRIKQSNGKTVTKILSNSTHGNMVKVWEEEHWVKCWHVSKDGTPWWHPKVGSRVYIFRKIINVPKEVVDNFYTISVSAKPKVGFEPPDDQYAVHITPDDSKKRIESIEIYTPLRQTFRLKKHKDPTFDPTKPHNGQFLSTGP